MKNVIKLFVVIAVTISASFVNATEPTFKVKVVGEKKFRVEVTDIKGSSMAFIKNENGQVLFKEKSKGSLIRKTFDFSRMENGNYHLIVKDDFKIRTLPVAVTNEGIEVNELDLQKTFFPVVEKNDNEVLVRLLSNRDNDLSITVRTMDGDLLTRDIVEAKVGLIGKRYQLSPGSYAITVSSDDFADTEYFKIR